MVFYLIALESHYIKRSLLHSSENLQTCYWTVKEQQGLFFYNNMQWMEAFYWWISHFCSRLQMMTMPVESAEASKLSSQLKLTSKTGPP